MKFASRKYAAALLLVCFSALAGSPHAGAQPAPEQSIVHTDFVRVIDGDTVEIWRDDSRWGIGYLSIDAPEGNTACGMAATARQWELTAGGVVLTPEAGVDVDDRGRRLYKPYTLDGRSIEAILVAEGLAKVGPNAPGGRQGELRRLEAQARIANAGCVWGHKGGPAPVSRKFPPRQEPRFVDSPDNGRSVVSATGFEDRLVASGFSEPTTFEFVPDGRIFVAEKSGTIQVWKNGQKLPVPLLNIDDRVNDYWDHGLIGMAIDPDFASNGYIYVLYTYENNASDYSGTKTARLSRFTVVADTASPASEFVIMGTSVGATCDTFPANTDCIPSEGPSHSVGNVRFGADGKLYATFGDASSFNFVDDRALRAQDVNRLNGKMVRINTDGTGVPDNPFWDGNPSSIRSKVWAYGLRNAFRFNFHPSRNSLYIGDVGWNEREEVTVATKGSNLGWPCYEGPDQQAGYQSKATCQALYAAGPSAVKAPLYSWSHSEEGCCGAAAVGGAFTTSYVAPYDGAYFFADYSKDWIRYFKTNSSDNIVGGVQPFLTGANAPVSIQRGPNGDIYYLAINVGEIHQIRQSVGNRAPTAVLTASPTDGLAPLAVSFSSAGSSDPDNNQLTFSWDFGDGSTATGPTAAHTYTANGTYTATLSVSDGAGGTDSKTVSISVGNRRPLVTISSPTTGTTYKVGDVINLSASASDPDDGPLPGSNISWDVVLHHNVHLHPFLTTTGATTSFVIPDHGDDTYFTINAYATDSAGLQGSATVEIHPQTVLLTLESSPTGLALTYDGVSVSTPHTVTTVANSAHTIAAPSPQGNAVFQSWSDGGAPSHNISLGTANESRLATFSVAQQITFDDLSNPNRTFSGAYPSGVATWPTNRWYLSGPWGALSTNSVSFLSGSQTSGTFTFSPQRVLLAFVAYNGGGGSATVTVACGTNPTRSQVLAAGQTVTITTNWTAPCGTVTLTSSNGWDTNFDAFTHDAENTGPDLTPPVISGVQAGALTQTGASITWTTDEPSTTQVEYGLTSTYGSFAPPSPNTSMVTAHTQALTGLQPGTQYHYRVVSRDAAGNASASSDFTFLTVAADTTPPTVSGVNATGVTTTGATIVWTTNEPSTTQVDYGPSTAYGSQAPVPPNPSLVSSHSQALAGLNPNTLYHYRVRSTDAAGNTRVSDDFTFTTLAADTTPPAVTGVNATGVTTTGATIVWTTDEPSTTQVDYGLSTAYGSQAPVPPNASLVTSHSQALTGLSPDTLYHCRVRSTDAAGNTRVSDDFTFTTAPATATAALKFDGSNDRATVNDSNSLDLTGPMTIETWVKFDALPSGKWQTLVFKQGTSGSMAYALYYHEGAWFEIRSGSANVVLQDDRPLQTGAWYHIAAVYDRTTMRIYVNGQLTASRAFTGAVMTSNLPLTLGYNTVWTNEQLSGTLDEIRISRIARYSSNFSPSGSFATDADTSALWHLDEGTGQTSADASANGNTLRRGANTNNESSDPAWVDGAPLSAGSLTRVSRATDPEPRVPALLPGPR